MDQPADESALLAAIDSLRTAVDASPDNPVLMATLAQLLLSADQVNSAIELALRVLAMQPNNPAGAEVLAAATAALTGTLLSSDTAPAFDGGEHAKLTTTSDADAAGDEIDGMLKELMDREGRDSVLLSHIAGLDDVKQRLETSFLGPIRNPSLVDYYGASLRGGLLLYGPPGCGKTFVARAVAGELGARFVSVGLHEVLDMYLGNSERQLHQVFEQARADTPSVLFFDELDALGQKRSRLGGGAMRNVVAQLLNELDSVAADNEGVFVLAATNQPWDVDVALRRPGRFDRTVLVTPPDTSAREAILAYHLRHAPTTPDLSLSKAARVTDGYSGADLMLIARAAVEEAMTEAARRGSPIPIGNAHLDAGLKSVRRSTDDWFESARNFVEFANTNGQYDDLAAYMRTRQ